MNTTEIAWTAEHSAAASKEGWDLFEVDAAGYFEIQKIDEEKRFDTDEAAVSFVARRAATSSPTNGSHYLIAQTIHRWFVKNLKRPEVGTPLHTHSRKSDRGTLNRQHYYPNVPRLGNVAVSRHALKRMDEQNISQLAFEHALLTPEKEVEEGTEILWRERANVRVVIIHLPVPLSGAKLVKTVMKVGAQAGTQGRRST